MPSNDRDRGSRDNRTMIELEVQRRLTAALAAAGVSQGVLTREVLFMLPNDFVRAYVQLFDRALKESVVSSGAGRGVNAGTPVVRGPKGGEVMVNLQSNSVMEKHDTRQVRGELPMKGGGGKRFKQHWIIRDEEALKIKSSVDRKLRRIASGIARDIARESQGVMVIECKGCTTKVDCETLGFIPRFCPKCGIAYTAARSG